jgi:hypothetical protein
LNAVRRRYGIDEREIGQLATLLAKEQAMLEARRKAQEPSTAPTTAPAITAGGATAVPATQKAAQPEAPR